MPRTIQEIKNLSPRFRILVIGRRNAGKTTILKKMCDSDGSDLQIVDANGKQVDPSILEPNRQRGMSDIENEITFRSNPLFVFHDSRGIEAGAEHEKDSQLRTEYLWNFLRKRSRSERIKDQIHAVWFCIPMDEQRAPSAQFELAFFNARESPVPIIAVCTKFEALLDSEMSGEDDSSDAEEEARQAAQSKFDRTVLQALRGTSHPPDQIVQLQNLDEPTAGCAALTERTYAAIHDKTLSDLFALAQHNSFSVGCTKVLQAMTETSWKERMRSSNNEAFETVCKHTKSYMPMWRYYRRYRDDENDNDDYRYYYEYYRDEYRDEYHYRDEYRDENYNIPHHALPPFLTSLFGESSMIIDISHWISIAIVVCIIFVFTGQMAPRAPWDLVEPVLQLLRVNTSFATSITKFVADARSEFPHEVDRPKLVDRFVRIVMMNVEALNAAWVPVEVE